MAEKKDTLNRTEGRFDITEEMISKCEDRIDTNQNETQIEKVFFKLKASDHRGEIKDGSVSRETEASS